MLTAFSNAASRRGLAEHEWNNGLGIREADGDIYIDIHQDTVYSDGDATLEYEDADELYQYTMPYRAHSKRDLPSHQRWGAQSITFQGAQLPVDHSAGIQHPQMTPQQQRTLLRQDAMTSGREASHEHTLSHNDRLLLQKNAPHQRNSRRQVTSSSTSSTTSPDPKSSRQLTRTSQVTRTGDNPRRFYKIDRYSGALVQGPRRRSLLHLNQDRSISPRFALAQWGSFGAQQKIEPPPDQQPVSPSRPGRQLTRTGQITRTAEHPRKYHKRDPYDNLQNDSSRRSIPTIEELQAKIGVEPNQSDLAQKDHKVL